MGFKLSHDDDEMSPQCFKALCNLEPSMSRSPFRPEALGIPIKPSESPRKSLKNHALRRRSAKNRNLSSKMITTPEKQRDIIRGLAELRANHNPWARMFEKGSLQGRMSASFIIMTLARCMYYWDCQASHWSI